MQITEKGQVTIPRDIRERYGFLPHTEIEFIENKGRIYIKSVPPSAHKMSRGRSLIEHMRGKATVKMTTAQIMQLTRDKE